MKRLRLNFVTLVAVASLLALSIVFMPQAWLASVLAAPAAVAFIAPSVIALGALGAYTTNAVNAKLAANNADNEEEGSVHNELDTEAVDKKDVQLTVDQKTTDPVTSIELNPVTKRVDEVLADGTDAGLESLNGPDVPEVLVS